MRIINVRNYEGLYAVSDEGVVYNLRTGEEMKPYVIKGYKSVNLTKNGAKTPHRVNRLVFFSFNPHIPMTRGEATMAVDHINEDKADNRLCNLRYITTRENVAGCSAKNKNGLPRGVNHLKSGKYAAGIQLDKVRYHLGVYETADEAGNAYKAALFAYEMNGEVPDTSATSDRVKYSEGLPQGVYVNRRSGRYVSFAQLNGARYYLGIYNTIEEAVSARQSAIDNYTTNSTLPTKSETKVKFCKSCNTEKPVSEFYYVPSHGYSWMCKECSKEYARQKRAEEKETTY